jgi:hypothetical protein
VTKASDNDYPSLLLTEQGSAPSSPAASHQRLYIRTSDHSLVTVNSSGTVTPVSSGGTSPLLAVHQSTAGDASTSSTSFVDADATNLAVTFTAPASGNVIVTCSAVMSPDSGGANNGALAAWGLRESTSNITPANMYAARSVIVSAIANYLFISMRFYLTGVSAGSHTYKWSHKVSAGTTVIVAGAASPALMEVWG